MKVLFTYSADFQVVRGVYWQDKDGVKERMLLSDGSVREDRPEYRSLERAYHHMCSPYHPVYVAEVDDVRSAFKYLGKSSDFVETLPNVSISGK